MKTVINAKFLSEKITGIQRYSIEISKILKQILGEEAVFVAPNNIIHKELAEELGVKIIGTRKGFLWEQKDLPEYLAKNNNPLLLNLRNSAPLTYKKNIVVIHDLIFMKNPEWFAKKMRFFHRLAALILLKNSLKVVTVSEFSKNDIINTFGISPQKIEVINNGVPLIFKEYANMPFENNYGDYILAVASCLSPRKNISSLAKAFLKLQNPNLKLIIVGEKIKNFSENIPENKNIIFAGQIDDKTLAGLYKNAKLLAFPSYYEGFGIPPLEAMYLGCPVLASNTGSLPEVCGDAAYYVTPESIEEIEDGLKKLLSDDNLRTSLIEKGYKRQELFSIETSANKFKKIIENHTSL
jgi:glycosyltransferase involved in cell wall biosynthesis